MTKRLDQLKPGEAGRIKDINGEADMCQRLTAIGFLPESEVSVVRVAPLGDPMTVELGSQQISIRKSQACGIEIDS